MLRDFAYVRARSIEEAMRHLGSSDTYLHAGGTDLLGCLRDGVFDAAKVVSISRLEELEGIRTTSDGGLSIGALTTIADVARSSEVGQRYPGLAQAAATVGSPQLRNQGTLGGNLCQRPRCWYFRGEFHCAKKGGDRCYAVDGENRYHAILGGDPCYIVHPSDTAPMLMALGAAARIIGSQGERVLPIEEFFVLPSEDLLSENVLGQGEMVTEVLLPAPSAGSKSSYRKVRERGAWDFALASVAAALTMNGDRVDKARLVLGGVAPRPWRTTAAEREIEGKSLNSSTIRAAAVAATEEAEALEQNAYKIALVQGVVEESLAAF